MAGGVVCAAFAPTRLAVLTPHALVILLEKPCVWQVGVTALQVLTEPEADRINFRLIQVPLSLSHLQICLVKLQL